MAKEDATIRQYRSLRAYHKFVVEHGWSDPVVNALVNKALTVEAKSLQVSNAISMLTEVLKENGVQPREVFQADQESDTNTPAPVSPEQEQEPVVKDADEPW
jgi:hypothetical protein